MSERWTARHPKRGGATVALALGALFMPAARAGEFSATWPEELERTWVGPEFWANRLQDWRLRRGRLELADHAAELPYRTVHILPCAVDPERGSITLEVTTGAIDGEATMRSGTGFLVGAGRGMEWRAAALIHHSAGRGAGVFAGIDGDGRLFLRDLEDLDRELAPRELARGDEALGRPERVQLLVNAGAFDGERARVSIRAIGPDGTASEAAATIPRGRLAGGVALVSHSGNPRRRGPEHGGYWFRGLRLRGSGLVVHEERVCGPVLSTQYTRSARSLHLTAQLLPVASDESRSVALEVQGGGGWRRIATREAREDSLTATFHVSDWEDSRDVSFRVVLRARDASGMERDWTREGIVRKDPVENPEIVVAGFTGNHNNSHRILSGNFDWVDGMWFPHAEMVERIRWHRPDLLFFSGDQVYEGDSPSWPDTDHLRLDYLYKWYLWCWAWGDLARDTPCITIPDDHDVYQGNLWGEGGRSTDKDDKGGYVHPAWFVRLVEHTQTDNLPPPYHDEPVEQGIGRYYTSLVWGRIGIAVLEDRKFKSGCNGRIEGRTRGRADHINDPEFDIRRADVPGLELLGAKQEGFVREWAADWRGQDMKLALSQTIFANMATHHGAELFRLIADLDSNGWPQSGRRRALDALRRGFAFHLAGDQHLGSLIQHGIDEYGDAPWSFCVPSIANFYPRAWIPEGEGKSRPAGRGPAFGEHVDGLGNLVTVYATTNPWHPSGKTGIPKTGREPSDLHDRMPGYGIVRFRKPTQEITVECWPRGAVPGRDPQYEGWPHTLRMTDNYGRKPAAWLPELRVEGLEDPVVQVAAQATGEVLYTLRIRGRTFRPRVFSAKAKYRVTVGEPGTTHLVTVRDLEPATSDDAFLEIRVP